jgi:ABC-type transport system involved in multi-copper enzyme maturation permease subunit
MFMTLLIKEWKDKAVIALFGLIMMAAFAAAFLALDGQDDFRELLAAGFLSLFFPAIGAILGAGAFESEFRDGAWAYLLSRPVRKETVWLAKLAALLSVLAGYWLIFLGLTAAVPGLGGMVAGYRIPGMLDSEVNLFPLVLFTSLFLFSVAFSLSLLSEKLLGLVLGSIFLGSLVQAALTYVAFKLEGRGLLSKAGLYPWLDAYKLALVLSCLAFLVASLLTFRRVDFSQPKRKAASLAKHSALFLIAAWFLAALWPTLRPGRPEELESRIEVVGANAYFATTRGFYRYDIARDSLKKVARWRSPYVETVIGGGKLLYTKWDPQEEGVSLRVMNLDGTEKRTLLGAGPGADPIEWRPWGFLLSPDGRKAAAITVSHDKDGRSRPEALLIVPTNGSGLNETLPLDPALRAQLRTTVWLRIAAWKARPDSLILQLYGRDVPSRLWTCDPATGAQRQLFEAARIGFHSVSPQDGSALITYRLDSAGPLAAARMDLTSGKTIELARFDVRTDLLFYSVYSNAPRSANGEDVAMLIMTQEGFLVPAYFCGKEGRTIVADGAPIEASSSEMPSILWAAGDTRLAVVLPKDRLVKILDRNLREVGRIRFPDAVHDMSGGQSTVRGLLLLSRQPEGVWRLDLDTEKWKRIW